MRTRLVVWVDLRTGDDDRVIVSDTGHVDVNMFHHFRYIFHIDDFFNVVFSINFWMLTFHHDDLHPLMFGHAQRSQVNQKKSWIWLIIFLFHNVIFQKWIIFQQWTGVTFLTVTQCMFEELSHNKECDCDVVSFKSRRIDATHWRKFKTFVSENIYYIMLFACMTKWCHQ